MIVEQRTYTLVPGATAEYLEIYEREGLEIQRPILGNLFGYFSSEVGPLNRIVHMWAYEDFEDRARRRAELLSNPDWNDFVKKLRPLIQHQESCILRAAPFSPPN